MSNVTTVVNLKDRRSEELGDEITELYGYITAATWNAQSPTSSLKINPLLTLHSSVPSGRIGLNWKCGIGMNAAREKKSSSTRASFVTTGTMTAHWYSMAADRYQVMVHVTAVTSSRD